MNKLQKKRSIKDIVILIIKFAVVIGAFTYLIGSGKLDFTEFSSAFEKPKYIAIGVVLVFIPMLVCFFRHQLLLRAVGVDLAARDITRLGFIGCFFNTFMLGGMGGDVVKVAYIIKESGKRAPVIAGTMMDRVMGLLGMIALAGIAMVLTLEDVVNNSSLHTTALAIYAILICFLFSMLIGIVSLAKGRRVGFIFWSALLLACIIGCGYILDGVAFTPVEHVRGSIDSEVLLKSRMVVVTAVALVMALLSVVILPSCQPGRSFNRFMHTRVPLGDKFMGFVSAILLYKDSLGVFLLAFIISLAIHGLNLLSFYFFGMCIKPDDYPELVNVLFAAPLSFVANAVPVPGGGLGVGENAFEYFLSLCKSPGGVAITGGAAIFLLWRFWYFLISIVIGLPLYIRGKKELIEAEEEYLENEDAEEKRLDEEYNQ